MILLKSKKININLTISEQIALYESTINFSGLICNCGSRNLSFHDTYERNVIEGDNAYKINIKRVICNNCKHTHALIPSFLMPYYQSPAMIIIENIEKMVEEEKSTFVLEKETNISHQKLNQWRNFYYALLIYIREVFSKIVEIKTFYESKNRIKVYHAYKPSVLVQIAT